MHQGQYSVCKLVLILVCNIALSRASCAVQLDEDVFKAILEVTDSHERERLVQFFGPSLILQNKHGQLLRCVDMIRTSQGQQMLLRTCIDASLSKGTLGTDEEFLHTLISRCRKETSSAVIKKELNDLIVSVLYERAMGTEAIGWERKNADSLHSSATVFGLSQDWMNDFITSIRNSHESSVERIISERLSILAANGHVAECELVLAELMKIREGLRVPIGRDIAVSNAAARLFSTGQRSSGLKLLELCKNRYLRAYTLSMFQLPETAIQKRFDLLIKPSKLLAAFLQFRAGVLEEEEIISLASALRIIGDSERANECISSVARRRLGEVSAIINHPRYSKMSQHEPVSFTLKDELTEVVGVLGTR
jgi:hypothetical protein